MPCYEHVFIARPDVSSQHVESLVETFSNVLTEGGGNVGKTEYWGLRNPCSRYARMLEWVTPVNNSGATRRLRWLRLVNK